MTNPTESTESSPPTTATHTPTRTPTAGELAAQLYLSEAEVIEGLVAANGYTAGSLDVPTDSRTPHASVTATAPTRTSSAAAIPRWTWS